MLSLERIIVEDYLSGVSLESLKRKYHKDGPVLRRIILGMGEELRSFSKACRISTGYSVNDKAFSIDTPDANYWAGFLAGDGHIKNNLIDLTLKRDDLPHLQKFMAFAGATHPIFMGSPLPGRKIDRGQPVARFSSEEIVKDLLRYGITERKTFTMTVPAAYRSDRDYMRGMIESDGHISIRKSAEKQFVLPIIGVCGTYDVVSCFSDFAERVTDYKPAICPNQNIFQSRLYSKNAVKMIRELYDGATTFLERKQRTAMQILWLWG